MKAKIYLYYMIITTIVLIVITSCSTNASDNKLKIGTYDSRAVAYAYFISDMYKIQQQKIDSERDKIMEAKDTAKWKETISKVCTEQYLLHQRVFAIGSAASVLRKIEKQLPSIAKSAGVDIIVSKWELTWKDSSVVVVDLTDNIAQLFIPLNKLGKTYDEIKKTERIDVDDVGIDEVIEIWNQFEKKYMGK